MGQRLSKSEILDLYNSSDTMDVVIAVRKSRDHGLEFVDQLMQALEHDFYEIRAYAAKSLGSIQHKPAIAEIIPLLFDEVEEVRFSAADALGNFQSALQIKPLIETLSDHSRETRRLATTALTRQDSAELQQEITTWLDSLEIEDYDMETEEAIHKIDVSRGIMEACSEFHFSWVPQVLEFGLQSPDLEMIRLAVISIGNQKFDQFLPQLLELRLHEDDDLRLAVVYSLTQVEFDNKLGILSEYIDDSYEFIREILAKYLPTHYPRKQITSALELYIDDEVPFVRAALASAMRDEVYLDLLAELISDHWSTVRKNAITSLGHIGSSALSLLEDHEEDDELVQIALENALANLNQP